MDEIEAKELWMIPALLLIPGIYLLWFAVKKKEFFRLEIWRRWTGRAGLVALLLDYPNRLCGPSGARVTLALVACTIIFLGAWISLILCR